ncbi:ORF6N domain-containing protein, partial [Levilactobacillus spicheri]
MNQLKVIGKENIGKYEFTGIEGGFGEGKRAMTVKDIAQVHGKDI